MNVLRQLESGDRCGGGAVVTLLAATDETVELAKDASFTLAVAQDVL